MGVFLWANGLCMYTQGSRNPIVHSQWRVEPACMTVYMNHTVSNFVKWLEDVNFVFFSHLKPCVCLVFCGYFISVGYSYLNFILAFSWLQYPMTILYDPARKKEPSSQYVTERETCLKYFEKWSERDQVEFVEHLLSRMCHYQHGHINSYLKPMLQRDFISLLPSRC